MTELLPNDANSACLVGRMWRPDVKGPSVIAIDHGRVRDITSREAPTMRDLLELDDPAGHVRERLSASDDLGDVIDLAEASRKSDGHADVMRLLAPCDLQALKACGVTFASSMIERVIEEQADGDPAKAAAVRERCAEIIGPRLSDLKAGSEQAAEVKEALIAEGMWSQYLEVGIGPDAEVFTKSQPMSSVGWGAAAGLHPISVWSNPEPEVVLAVNSRGEVKGATLGNDVNLRDVEGRSALLLSKAKDNNASCAIGPFIRLFDDDYSMDDVRNAELDLRVEGEDGFVLEGHSLMSEISRDPLDLVAQTIGRHHQYPDGFVLFLGTLFSPTQDRDEKDQGFTHKTGDVVTISEPRLGALTNVMRLSNECPEWTFGVSALMRNLAARKLI